MRFLPRTSGFVSKVKESEGFKGQSGGWLEPSLKSDGLPRGLG
jgi:hypothetical protein